MSRAPIGLLLFASLAALLALSLATVAAPAVARAAPVGPQHDAGVDREDPDHDHEHGVDDDKPHRLQASAGVFGEVGPLKGSYSVGLRYRYTYSRSESALWDGLHVQGAIDVFPNPFIPVVRLEASWLPIGFFRLVAAYTNYWYVGWENDLGHGLSFPSADSPTTAEALAAREGQQEKIHLQRVEIRPILQLQIDSFIFFHEAELGLWFFEGDPPDAGRWWYDMLYDSLLDRQGVDGLELVMKHRTALAWEAWKGEYGGSLIVGLVNSYTWTRGSGMDRDRFGAVAIWTPIDRHHWFSGLTVLVHPGYTVFDRHRSGEFFLEAAVLVDFDLAEW